MIEEIKKRQADPNPFFKMMQSLGLDKLGDLGLEAFGIDPEKIRIPAAPEPKPQIAPNATRNAEYSTLYNSRLKAGRSPEEARESTLLELGPQFERQAVDAAAIRDRNEVAAKKAALRAQYVAAQRQSEDEMKQRALGKKQELLDQYSSYVDVAASPTEIGALDELKKKRQQ